MGKLNIDYDEKELKEIALTTANKQRNEVMATIDFSSMYDKAVKIFAEQAMIGQTDDDIDPKALRLSKLKSENFLAAVAGLLEISHKVDLLLAEKHKFKREDELRLMNNLRQQFEKTSNYSDKLIDSCMGQLDYLIKEMDTGILDLENIEKLSQMQGIMERAIGNLNNISLGATKLIKSERETGGRSSGTGTSNTSSVQISTFLDSFGKDGDGDKNNKGGGNGDGGKPQLPGGVVPRKLGFEELSGILEKETPKGGRPRKSGKVFKEVVYDHEIEVEGDSEEGDLGESYDYDDENI